MVVLKPVVFSATFVVPVLLLRRQLMEFVVVVAELRQQRQVGFRLFSLTSFVTGTSASERSPSLSLNMRYLRPEAFQQERLVLISYNTDDLFKIYFDLVKKMIYCIIVFSVIVVFFVSSNVSAIRTPVFQPIRGRYSNFDGNTGL